MYTCQVSLTHYILFQITILHFSLFSILDQWTSLKTELLECHMSSKKKSYCDVIVQSPLFFVISNVIYTILAPYKQFTKYKFH